MHCGDGERDSATRAEGGNPPCWHMVKEWALMRCCTYSGAYQSEYILA